MPVRQRADARTWVEFSAAVMLGSALSPAMLQCRKVLRSCHYFWLKKLFSYPDEKKNE
jgi:hypothetical protein